MKMSDINKVFTDKVAEYMANGYVINVQSMSGTQGEVGKVDLVKGDELIRIYMEDVMGSFHDDYDVGHRDVVVGRWFYPAHEAPNRTVWYGELEIIEGIHFWEVSREKWYVEDFEEARRIKKLRYSRYRSDRLPAYPGIDMFESDRAREIAVNYLKRKAGYQRVNADLVKVIKTRRYYNSYSISYHGHSYSLH